MRIFVISLKDSKHRRKNITSQMKRLGLDFEFFDAVDARITLSKKYEKLVDRKLAEKRLGRAISNAEIGCALSHNLLYKKIVAEKTAHTIILEDDAILADEFSAIVNKKILQQSKHNFIVFNHFCTSRSIFDFGKKLYKNYRMYKSVDETYCTAGYYINYDIAEKLLKCTTPVSYVADWGGCDVNDMAVFISPRPIQQPPMESGNSYIENNRPIQTEANKTTNSISIILMLIFLPYCLLAMVFYKLFNIRIIGGKTQMILKDYFTVCISPDFEGK